MKISFGDVRKKRIITSNHFVSHMIEHIAWRMGLSIDLEWKGENWRELGKAFGEEMRKFPIQHNEGSALGMIDDGSAAISVVLGSEGAVFSTAGGVDLEWFLNLRCEQLTSGQVLKELLEGLSEGLSARISLQIWTLEDTHHTWEGIYRGVGIALSRIFMPEGDRMAAIAAMNEDKGVETKEEVGEIVVLEKGVHRAKVRRGTAETKITVTIDFCSPGKEEFHVDVDGSIRDAVREIEGLFRGFAKAFGVGLEIRFQATTLSSSHVVLEDIGLVMGRALLEILKTRMEKYGVNGAGSNLLTPSDAKSKNVRVGVSVEGRKFWRLIPQDGNMNTFRRNFVIGHNVMTGLRTEDLDDFLDGLSGGMSASIMVHIRDYSHISEVWQELFQALGTALSNVYIANPYRRGVPPGVKATLA